MGGRKLFVEVTNAVDLMPKDGQGSASPYCVVDYDGQRRQTEVKSKDLNPVWNCVLEFEVFDPECIEAHLVKVAIFSAKKSWQRTPSFLGRITVRGTHFRKKGEEVMVFYKLKRRSFFSQVKGEVGLKVWWCDEEPPSEAAPPPEETAPPAPAEAAPPAASEPPPAEPAPEATAPAAAAEAAPEAAAAASPEPAVATTEPPAVVEQMSIEMIEKAMMMQPLFWDHNLPYACEVPWDNFIPSSVLDNPYINLPPEEWIQTN